MGDLREPNGVVLEEFPVTSASTSSPSSGFGLGQEVWARAEVATQEIIRQVQPTVVSEERRRDVIDYVQRLLKGFLGCEVFPFGSVPVKTYLPDGDIDLTAFCGFNIEEAFARDVSAVLQAEDRNPTAEFVVKDVQLIHAEVKLVKCLIQNIVVDISFNQIGGLCALCFLEEVDRLIGKDHLFKRSIIMIKAWCYYESRILGAHHGLISTYALEILVLYIFHLFHLSLNGPLAVLHKFLDYFSKFDWDNFCVSLSGPVRIASLPELVVERPESIGGDLLLSDEFIRDCVTRFSVPSRGSEMNYRTFMQKHLNIVDPLKENNNLGRSVSKGNFFRIRSAFSFGARKLGHILSQPQENIAEEVRKFFANTLDRHGKGQRPDVQDPFSGCNGLSSEMLLPAAESFQGQVHGEQESVYSSNSSSEGGVGVKESVDVVSNLEEPETYLERTVDKHKKSIKKGIKKSSTQKSSVSELSKEEVSASASLSVDVNDLAIDGIPDLRISEYEETFRPHLYCSQPMENGKSENGDLDEELHIHPTVTHNMRAGRISHQKANGFMYRRKNDHNMCNSNDLPVSKDSHLRHSVTNADSHGVQDSHSIYHSYSSGITGSHEIAGLLPDLSGDVDCQLQSLQYGRWWYDHGLMMPIQPLHLPPPPMYQTKGPWDAFRQPVQFRQEVVPQMNVNGVGSRPLFFPANPPVTHYMDEIPKARGIGTYFPTTNHHAYRERSSPKGRHQGQLKSPRTNGRGPTLTERIHPMQTHVRQGVGRPKVPDSQEYSPRGKVCKEANGFIQAPEKVVEYEPPRHTSPEASLQESENCWPQDADPPTGISNGVAVFVIDDGGIPVQSYRLKDEEDFPPLSG